MVPPNPPCPMGDVLTPRQSELVSLREYIDELFRIRDAQVALQHVEYLRRLSDLNHEASRLKEMQQTYVPREVYEAGHQQLVAQLLAHTSKLTEQTADLSRAVALVAEKTAGNATDIGRISNSLTWFIRLVTGAGILGFLAYVTQHVIGAIK